MCCIPARDTKTAHGTADAATPAPLTADAAPVSPRRFTPAERDAAVLSVMPAIRGIVFTTAGKYATRHDIDDLLGIAHVAACECAAAFEPGGRAKFETFVMGYLKKRIRGQWAKARGRQMKTVNGCDLGEFVAAGGDWGGRGDGDPAEIAAERDANWERHWDAAFPPPADGPTASDLSILSAINGPVMREVVTLSVFERLSVPQVALRTGLAVKDVRLSLLQAGKVLAAAKARADAGEPRAIEEMAAAGTPSRAIAEKLGVPLHRVQATVAEARAAGRLPPAQRREKSPGRAAVVNDKPAATGVTKPAKWWARSSAVSDEQRAAVEAMAAAGTPRSEIAAAVGLKPNHVKAVIRAAREAGRLPALVRIDAEIRARIVALAADGSRQVDIAAAVGVSAASVWNVVRADRKRLAAGATLAAGVA